jgi:anti-anti-sigma regulatory factor
VAVPFRVFERAGADPADAATLGRDDRAGHARRVVFATTRVTRRPDRGAVRPVEGLSSCQRISKLLPLPSVGSVVVFQAEQRGVMISHQFLQSERFSPAARVVRPTGALTVTAMAELRRWVSTCLSEGVRRIVVDLSEVTSISDSAAAGLVVCARAARAAHGVLLVTPGGLSDEALLRRRQ